MTKQEQILRHAQNDEERQLGRRLIDLSQQADRRGVPAATHFLTPPQQAFCTLALTSAGISHCFAGGYEGAERRVVWIGSEQPGNDVIGAVRIRHPAPLTHRDFLGSALACGIKRETLGDILVGQQETIMLVLREIMPYLLIQYDSAGRIRLTVEEMSLDEIVPPAQAFEMIRNTVASARLDAVLASGFRLPREKAQEAIRRGLVHINWRAADSPSHTVRQGDILALRGKGKMTVESIGATSRKGRIWVEMKRFV